MDLHFNEGDRFYIDADTEYEIVDIDREDEEYPYECYPVEIVEKTKNILTNGVLVDEDEELCEYKDEAGEVYVFNQGDNISSVIYDWFPDDRRCLSDYEILAYQYDKLKKEFDALKSKVFVVEEVNSDVNLALLDKVAQDDEGYVTDNINDFFDYMFPASEEWTFKELAALLTPAMKEELIFEGNFIGSIGKANGKYYYHPDIDDLIEKPSVNEVVENAVRKSEALGKGADVKENGEKGLE